MSQIALIYTRVSSHKQDEEGGGLQSQESVCRAHAERIGLPVGKVFSDTASGSTAIRPGIGALFNFIQLHPDRRFVLIIDDLNRLARDVSIHIAFSSKLKQLGVELLTPTQSFDNSASSEFLENMMAVFAQHQRKSNTEQVNSRIRGQLLRGNWIFAAPRGYKKKRAQNGDHLLVPDGKKHAIVQQALEGFASGRFQSHAEVRRFLVGQPKSMAGNSFSRITIDKVDVLLRHPLYAGYYEHERYEVPLTKANADPMIPLEVHQRILEILTKRSTKKPRIRSADFPAKGFVACIDCKRPFTASFSKGKKQRYPYYHCGTKGCPMKGKTVPRDKLEGDLVKALADLKPSARAEEVFLKFADHTQNMRARTWKSDTDDAAELLAKAISQRARLTKRIADEEDEDILKELRERHRDARKEILRLTARTEALGSQAERSDFEHFRRLIRNPAKLWMSKDLETKRLIL